MRGLRLSSWTSLRLLCCGGNWHRIQRRLKCNEEDTGDVAGAVAVVRQLGRAVCISTYLENRLLLTVIGDMKLTRDQHHALWRCVQMKRNRRLGGYFEEHVNVVFCGVAAEDGDAASLRQERRAGPPLELRIAHSPGHRSLFVRRLCAGERAHQAQSQQRGTNHSRHQWTANQGLMSHNSLLSGWLALRSWRAAKHAVVVRDVRGATRRVTKADEGRSPCASLRKWHRGLDVQRCDGHTRSTSRRIDHSTASTSLRVASSMPFFCSASIASSMTDMNSCSLMFMPLCVANMSLPV